MINGYGAAIKTDGLNLRIYYTDSSKTTYDFNRDCIRTVNGGVTDDSSLGLIIDGAGLTIVGGGESASRLTELIGLDQSVSGAAKLNVSGTTSGFTSLTNSDEHLILSSDYNMYFITKCNTIANRVAVVLDTNKNFYPDVTGSGSLGTSSYHWNSAYINTVNGTTLNLYDGTKYSYFVAGARSTSSSEPAHVLFGSNIDGASFVPYGTQSHNLGLVDQKWNAVYATTLYGNLDPSNLSSAVSVGKGGTGRTTLTSNAIISGNGTSNVNMITTASGALYSTTANGAAKFGTLPVAQGGTGATSAANARTNLGLGSAATYSATSSVESGANELVTSNAVYNYCNTATTVTCSAYSSSITNFKQLVYYYPMLKLVVGRIHATIPALTANTALNVATLASTYRPSTNGAPIYLTHNKNAFIRGWVSNAVHDGTVNIGIQAPAAVAAGDIDISFVYVTGVNLS